MEIQRSFQGRSLFLPLLLIGVGLVWLFSNLGILQPTSLGVLFRLWPLVLIVIGLNLLFGRRSPALGNLIGIGSVVVIIGLMLVGPSLGWAQGAEIKTAAYSEPMGDVESAQVHLDLSVAESNVTALTDSDNLFEADVRYTGELVYDVQGEGQKTITLSEEDQFDSGINFLNWDFIDASEDLHWNIGLNPDVPFDLVVSGGLSDTHLDLSQLQLTGLNIDSGIGSLNLNLPAMSDLYDVTINAGMGTIDIDIVEGATLNLDISGGVGAVTIDVPDDAAVRIEANTGVGGIDVPSNYQRVSGDESDFVSEHGVWQSEDFENSDQQITIEFDGGVGSFTIE
jgi:hypothetical protein